MALKRAAAPFLGRGASGNLRGRTRLLAFVGSGHQGTVRWTYTIRKLAGSPFPLGVREGLGKKLFINHLCLEWNSVLHINRTLFFFCSVLIYTNIYI